MAEATDRGAIRSKRKAIWALLPYAVRLSGEGDGKGDREQQMISAFSRTFRHFTYTQGFVWGRVESFVAALFHEPRTPSLDRAITLVSPHFHYFDHNTVTRWSIAALEAPTYTEEVSRSVFDTLRQIASTGTLLQYIPVRIWLWSRRQEFLPPAGLRWGSGAQGALHKLRELGDTEILKAYLLLVWLDWTPFEDSALAEMCASIREGFNRIKMGEHREELKERLDHVLGQLDQGPDYLREQRPDFDLSKTEIAKNQYRELKQVLLKVAIEANGAPDPCAFQIHYPF